MVGGAGVNVGSGRRVAVGTTGARVGGTTVSVAVAVAAGTVAVAVSSAVGELVADGAVVAPKVGVKVGINVGAAASSVAGGGVTLATGAAGPHAANVHNSSALSAKYAAAQRKVDLNMGITNTCDGKIALLA